MIPKTPSGWLICSGDPPCWFDKVNFQSGDAHVARDSGKFQKMRWPQTNNQQKTEGLSPTPTGTTATPRVGK